MAPDQNDQVIKKMAQLLRNGATMLDLTCPKCDNILYRLKSSKIICPACNREVIIQDNTNRNETIESIETMAETGESSKIKSISNINIGVLSESINKIIQMLKKSNQINQLMDLSVILERLVKTYKLLNS
ncbi:MAG: hypothetical protein GF364_15115 [Candidatus Lokiarchaeota archaeon]|nr:hypothetical protein [Candidatus Lokiarchaeota archaeon]